jgi:signal transduction histidine kinase
MRLPGSLRARLAALYTGLVVLAVLGFGAGAYALLDAELHVSFDRNLVANVHHASDALVSDIGPHRLLHPDVRFIDQLAHTGGIVEVLAPDGAILGASDPANPLPLTASDMATGRSHVHQVRNATVAGDSLRMVVEPINSTDGSLVGLVSWAKPTDELEGLLRTVALALLVVGATVCFLAFGAGWLVAGRALAPVTELTTTARSVAASGDIAARVAVQTADDELGRLGVAFNEMLASIEENERGLERFLADASHQLRTPITTIRANLELAARGDVPAKERKLLYAEAKLESERMARLVAALLSLTRAELEPARPFDRVELDTVVAESITEVCRREGAPLDKQTIEAVVVPGDRDRLKELCHSLLDNARKYAPDGIVTVSLVAGIDAQIVISDTGIGISADERDLVFDRFYRGETARRLEPQGSGLGLAIAARIVEAHGGSIAVSDTPGGGTTVVVHLSRVDPSPR